MFVKSKVRLPLAAALLVSAAFTATASADISEIVFTIVAENENGVSTPWTARFDPSYFDPRDNSYDWSLQGTVALNDAQGNLIAGLSMAHVYCREDPQVDLNFAVFAGALNTTFTITSPHLSFGTMSNVEGRTSAGVSATDLNSDGVSVSSWNGDSIYTSRYNGNVPGGTTFRDEFNGTFSNPVPGQTVTIGAADFPGAGAFSPIAGPVSDMSSRFRFTLSAGDIASGTSLFEIREVPTPAGMTLLGLGGILVARRRR